uniref:Multidrug resistance-associated protein 5-like n=1 Tax=Saccoglossus kowalevskii TaxID=10224 RepID=A0ABM0MV02_SACKO|nr:PREDICTED: multidrug resistance-associated protein 5-like [Saccoglossus kowalevskii]
MGDYAATKDDHYYRLDHRSYSFAEAMNCHDFDLTEPSQNVNVSAYKPTIKHATEKNYDLPIDDAGLFSYLYFTWMSPLMKTAYKTGLQVTDLWGCAESDSAEFNCEKLHKLWSDELDIKGSAKASLVKVFLKFIKTEAIKATFSFVILDVAIFSTSLLIFALLDYIQGTEFNMPYALSLCLLLVIFDVVRSLSVSCGAVISLRAAVRLRSAILMISYKKMMSFCILHDQTVGEFVNLSTNDTQRIFEAVSSAVLLIAGPIMGIIIMIYTTVFLGPAGLIGSLIFFLMLPIQIVLQGNLVGVCGSVGSGKSSLISAILSHMQLLSGKVAIDGSIAYVSQQAWICNATIKENILFGLPYDRHWYEKSIFAACLQDDLELLPRGSDTEIGERGVTLSGGQKQRISLARAMYARRDIYLLDDPLSAVDAHVGKHIFKYFIKEGLCGKTVMFITHQLQYLSVCDHILVLKDGKIVECGTHEQMMASGLDYAQLYNCYLSETSEPNNLTNGHSAQNDSVFSEEHPDLDTSGSLRQDAKSIIGKSNSVASIADTDSNYDPLMTIEDKSEGNVKWKTYHEYIQNAGGYLLASFTLFTFAAVFACMTASNWWLGYWMANTSTVSEVFNYTSSNMTGNSTDIITDTSETNVFVSIYLIILGVLIVSTIVRVLIYVKTTLRASTRLHNKVFKVVFRAPMEFFDATPSGRILNRFSKDIDEVDVRLPMCMESMLNYAFIILFSLFSIIIVFPWYLLALLAFAVIFIVCYLYFHHALRELKRLDNITRSPWISHITTTIHGLSTIHAYGRTTQSIRKYAELVDANTVSLLLFCLSSRWVAVRLDVIAILSTFLTALMTVLSHGNIPSSYSGIALIYSVQFTGTFQLMVREMAECEARFTSVERILYYIKNLLAEAPSITDPRPPDDWPQQGVLEMKEVKMRYRDNLPLALNGISFKVDTMEKIGVVGRTGAGKSSLGTCLFRLVDTTSGDIYIDDVNIKTLGLHDLRSSISIIPQDPALFVGTIRYNLDPFNQYSDDDVWTALEKCYMKDTVRDIDGKLDGQVVECGGNFSVGERQLLCMARALLRNCKILILDEATAAIDTQTDSLIQQTIRDAFHGCTMLIIAHRLNTVLKCDKIMVMDKGMVVEFDTPSSLLQDPDSRFTSMMEAAEKI